MPFDLLAWLKCMADSSAFSEVTVMVKTNPQKRPLRLVAGRIPAEKAEEARERVRRQARKKTR